MKYTFKVYQRWKMSEILHSPDQEMLSAVSQLHWSV